MKNLLSSILSLLIILTSSFSSFRVEAKEMDDGPSSWAVEEVSAMYEDGILDDYFYSNYRSKITREDFAYMMLSIFKNYESLDLDMDKMEAFEDTDAESLLVARRMGLISGYEDNSFRPKNPISRQEMAHLMNNLIDLIKNFDIEFPDLEKDFNFKDKDEIYSYALESVERLTSYGILKGKSENYFKPFDNSTREEAILISYRLNSFIIDNSDYMEIQKDLNLSDYDLYFPEEKDDSKIKEDMGDYRPSYPSLPPLVEDKPIRPEDKPVKPEEKPEKPEEKPTDPEENDKHSERFSIKFYDLINSNKIFYEESFRPEFEISYDELYHVGDLMDESYDSIEIFKDGENSYILVSNPYIKLDKDSKDIDLYYFKQRDGSGALDGIIRNYIIRYMARTESGDLIEISNRDVGELTKGSISWIKSEYIYHKKFDGRDFYLSDPLKDKVMHIPNDIKDEANTLYTMDIEYEEGIEKVIYDVNYLDQEDNKILTSKKHFGVLNEEVEHQAIELEGYELVGDSIYRESLSRDLESIDFYYRLIEDEEDREGSQAQDEGQEFEVIPEDKEAKKDSEPEEEMETEESDKSELTDDVQEFPEEENHGEADDGLP